MLSGMIARVFAALLRAIQILLFAGVLLTWFPVDRNGRFVRMLHTCTAPLLMPVRALLRKVQFLRNIPFDFSYVVVFLLLELVIRLII